MAYDLLLRKASSRNWSRDPLATTPAYAEAAKSASVENKKNQLIALKAAADKGDKKAQKKWAKLSKKVVKLHLKAAKGNQRAAKQLMALNATGLFTTTSTPKGLKTSMVGSFIGADEILGSFVGEDTLTEIVGDDKLTEIVTSGAAPVIPAPLTDEEKGRIEKLAKLQMLAVRGNADALKQIVVINKALTVLQAKSSKGDPKAKRIIDTLMPTGLVEKISSSAKGVPTKLVLSGDDDAGMDEILGDDDSGMDEILGGEEIITSGDMGYNGHLAYLQGLGEEEAALALQGGSSEQNAARRRF